MPVEHDCLFGETAQSLLFTPELALYTDDVEFVVDEHTSYVFGHSNIFTIESACELVRIKLAASCVA